MTVPNEYERQRLARIERNDKLLKELGIQRCHTTVAARPPKSTRPRVKPDNLPDEGGPRRRSRRLQGSEADLGDDVTGQSQLAPKSMDHRGGVKAYRPPPAMDESALDAHNVHRFRTMSHAALQKRIWKIRRPEKLRSFINVLEGFQEAELAEEARLALGELEGS
ncbi:hypothetical protein ACKKBG_A02860 [Auxenochlorella protothecoides x Auxenochlorella symbiontica]